MHDMRKQRPIALEPAICNCLAVRQAARHLTQFYDRCMAGDGLRATQYSIIAHLARVGPLTIKRLATLLVMDRTAMGRALRPLARDKLVSIAKGRDERTRVVKLTPAGRARARSAAVRWHEAQEQFEAAFGAADAARLRRDLARMISATGGALPRRPPRP
jgi:DNA-binding MarR family transcriptional regulator